MDGARYRRANKIIRATNDKKLMIAMIVNVPRDTKPRKSMFNTTYTLVDT